MIRVSLIQTATGEALDFFEKPDLRKASEELQDRLDENNSDHWAISGGDSITIIDTEE